MSKLLILGAGGHGKVVAEAAELSGCYEKISFLDDCEQKFDVLQKFPILNGLNAFTEYAFEYNCAFVAIGNNELRVKYILQLIKANFEVPSIIHKNAHVSKYALVKSGSVILSGAVVNTGAEIGLGCIVNINASVDHDTVLKTGVHVSSGAVIRSMCEIKDYCTIGAGATIKSGTIMCEKTIVLDGGKI